MNGFSFNGRTSRKFQNVVVQKRGRGTATPTTPVVKENSYGKTSNKLPV
jgi:hypothetical protein